MEQPIDSLRAIFAEALGIPDADERARFLAESCGTDLALRGEIEELLTADANAAPGFLPGTAPRTDARSSPDAGGCGPEEKPSPDRADVIFENNAERVGLYRLLGEIGEGGCGTVYMAELKTPLPAGDICQIIQTPPDTLTGAPAPPRVALKVIKLGMDTKEVVARFEAERQALSLMDHPNIAKVLDAGSTTNGRPFFVMELVRGVKITDYCNNNRASIRQRLELVIRVCQAVQHAHQKGIIHRDIKPSNILVTVVNGSPVPKVIDFGIAKATQGRLTDRTLFTAFDQFLGTPAYVSPEQADLTNSDIDTRSDIYSLGVLLYELLTGTTPFATKALLAAGLEELRRTIREQEPVRPSIRLNALLPSELAATAQRRGVEAQKLLHLARGDLDWIVMKCLEKDRSRRYDTANGLAHDLQRHLNNEPVTARPPSPAYRFQKLVRRNKLAVASVTAILGALLLGAGLSVWQAIRAKRAEATAQEKAEEARVAGADARQQIRRLAVANGVRLQNEGDVTGALLWFIKSLSLAQGNPAQEQLERLRFTSNLRQCPQLLNIFVHNDRLGGAAFSPDGRYVVTASWDQTAQIWDTMTGEPTTPPLHHDFGVNHATFSPDGRWLLTACFGGAKGGYAQVWSTATGLPVAGRLRHAQGVLHAAFSSDGGRVISGSDDRTAQVWDSLTGEKVAPPLVHQRAVNRVGFSPDGQLVVTGGLDNQAYLWEASTSKLLFKLPQDGHVMSVEFSPDRRLILTTGGPTARLYDVKTGQEIVPALKHEDIVLAACFSPDGRWVLTGCRDQFARLWETATGTLQPHLLNYYNDSNKDNGWQNPVFSADGAWIVTASTDHTAQVWNAQTGKPVFASLYQNGLISHVAVSPDHRLLLTASWDHTARLWKLNEGTSPPPQSIPSCLINEAAQSPDGQRVVVASGKSQAQVLEAKTGKPLSPPLSHLKAIVHCALSLDGHLVSTASEDHTARVWEAVSGRALTGPLLHGDTVLLAKFSPDSRYLVTACYDQTVRVWEVATGQPVSPPIKHDELVEYAAFSADNQRLLTCCVDGAAYIRDRATGKPLTPVLKHKEGVLYGAFSSDGRLVATASYDRTARIWDAATGEPLVSPLSHGHAVLWAAFSADNRQLFTATQAGYWRWDLSADKRPLDDLRNIAQMLSGREIDQTDSVLALETDVVRLTIASLRAKYLNDWMMGSNRPLEAGDMAPDDPMLTRHPLTAADADYAHPAWRAASNSFPVDLSAYYTFNLEAGADFQALPFGRRKLNDTDFNIGGVIELAGEGVIEGTPSTNWVREVNHIKLDHRFQRIHFLHGSVQFSNSRRIGSFVLHYANGQQWEIPIVCGQDVRNLWIMKGEPLEVKRSLVAWTGKGSRTHLRIYQSTWANPWPDVPVASMDYVTSMTWPSPFLLAITLE